MPTVGAIDGGDQCGKIACSDMPRRALERVAVDEADAFDQDTEERRRIEIEGVVATLGEPQREIDHRRIAAMLGVRAHAQLSVPEAIRVAFVAVPVFRE